MRIPQLKFNNRQEMSLNSLGTGSTAATPSKAAVVPAINGASKATPANPAAAAARDQFQLPPHIVRHRIVLPVNSINQGTLTGLRYAQSLSSDVTAVHISIDAEETEALKKAWPTWGEGVRLVVLDSPHKMVLEPLLEYIQSLMALKQSNEVLTVVVPQSIRPRWWSNLSRTQMAVLLRLALPFETGIVITDVPYVIEPKN